MYYIVRHIDRASPSALTALARAGVALTHQAAGRTGLLSHEIQPRQNGHAIAGSAVTVLCEPGDNLIVHAAVDVCSPGDVLVVATTSPSTDGMFGDLLATALQVRGVAGLVLNAGVHDLARLRRMHFPVWSRAVHAQATGRTSPGSVNVPVVIAGQLVNPGDVVVADDDGVVVVPARYAYQVAEAALEQQAVQESKRAALAAGTLGVDLFNLRPLLADLGVQYVDRLPE
ncbi:4-carboxy-4-hydroxy-2-oxoadipate aldolase/oxaloacetate decarboxylase [Kineosporia babensis]|uniref:Putative 4-hydroxy-4-methyl-2-oxoglutarate aldolase n=1 Tax=Kineosporia babensis TaxID=499548 RepID=A0A9X1NMG7_9ACTN|nr:4-carboxy-4-hydroxy-2-oxoadipate aldolase/oxaloacetate decarboxylase [Kineosporia babensis]MCD5316484.1 4-carboxy-4-hydroxy-2-oxoadipate aldolase/oxaloacetate decarboxylase [Kineosporia babensis]